MNKKKKANNKVEQSVIRWKGARMPVVEEYDIEITVMPRHSFTGFDSSLIGAPTSMQIKDGSSLTHSDIDSIKKRGKNTYGL